MRLTPILVLLQHWRFIFSRLPELNVFGLAFLPMPEDEFAIAILYMDYHERIQLIARDIIVDDLELSAHPSTVLHPTPISTNILPCPTECVPKLLSVPPSQLAVDDEDEDEEGFPGGVLIVGGKKILLFELVSRHGQAKQRGKRRRLEARKKSTDAAEVEKAKEKEMEREGRKRKPKGSVEWPWSEVTAYVSTLVFQSMAELTLLFQMLCC